MVEINLLPWRARKLEYDKKRQRVAVMLGVLIALCLWASLHVWMQSQIDVMREQLKTLQTELTRLSTAHTQITAKISDNFSPRELIKLFGMLAASEESGVCFNQATFVNHELTLQGQSWSTISLLANLNKIKMPERFHSYVITKIDKKDKYVPINYSVKYKENDREED